MEATFAAHPLARLLEPRGVALWGAFQTPGSHADQLLKTLIEEHEPRGIHPANPKGGRVLVLP